MPLMGKKPFKRESPPPDLHPMEELFYCKITQEAFRDYDQLFERVILCNSLVWTCSVTGRNGLTFLEAIESEKNALLVLKKFPRALKKPILFLATLTERSRLNDMCDDVFLYVKDRYFVGETVDVSLNGIKKSCEVTAVISPEKETKSPSVKQDGTPRKPRAINPDKYKYEVLEKELDKKIVVKSQCISRPKGTLTKPHNKLFIKNNASIQDGIWRVKDEVIEKHDLENIDFQEMFNGPLPKYAVSPSKKKAEKTPAKNAQEKKKNGPETSGRKMTQSKLNFKKETEAEQRKALEKEQLEMERAIALSIQRANERKELKEKKLEQRLKEKEERKKQAEQMLIWKRPRDDLECDDLRDLPKPTPIDCLTIPTASFGDAVVILEFLNSFKSVIKLRNSFPQEFTLEHLEKALTTTDIQGYFFELIQVLLTALFQLNGREKSRNYKVVPSLENPFVTGTPPSTLDEAETIAESAASYPVFYHGSEIMDLQIDSFSITEILRLHIMGSGTPRDSAFSRALNDYSEDPGLSFKIEEPEILKKLSLSSMMHLNCEERLKVLTLLINQILSCAQFGTAIDDNLNKKRTLRGRLRDLLHSKNEMVSELKKISDGYKADAAVEGDKEPPAENGDSEQVKQVQENKQETVAPEVKQVMDEKQKRQLERQLGEIQRKQRELRLQIQRIDDYNQLVPVGTDRAFRRYWLFRSLPGIFVEDDDKYVGPCLLKETPQIPPNAVMNRTENTNSSTVNIKKYLHPVAEPKNGSSDKENDILQDLAIIQSDFYIPPKDNRTLSDLNTRVEVKREQNCSLCKEKMAEIQSNVSWICPHTKNVPPVFGLCTTSIETCPVHNYHSELRTQWSFFYKSEDLDLLVSGLNPRGFREGSLRESLIKEKEKFQSHLSKCPIHILNKNLPIKETPVQEIRKSQRRLATNNNLPNTSSETGLENVLKDAILELEHNIFMGALGSIKLGVQSRSNWREAIALGTYEISSVHLLEKLQEIRYGPKDLDIAEFLKSPVTQLACCLLQIATGVEQKCLNPPLGDSEASKRIKEALIAQIKDCEFPVEDNSGKPQSLTKFQQWQRSLVCCTSYPQVFLHLGSLERSISWSRSILKTCCRICRKSGDPENMLLCDNCNCGQHLYCLRPSLSEVPEGDWFCARCKPPVKTPQPPPKDTPISSQYNSEEEGEDEDESENEKESDRECELSEDNENESNNEDGPVIEVCQSCQGTGTVICCDGCPDVYHPECVGLHRIPKGDWLCPNCTKKEESKKRSQRSLNRSSKAEVSTLQTRFTARGSRRQPVKELDSSDSESSMPRQTRSGTKRTRVVEDDEEDSSDSEETAPKRARSERKKENSRASSENTVKRPLRDSAVRRSTKYAGSDDLLDYKTCLDIVMELMHHPASWPFLVPVSKKDAPEYHLVVKQPMDLGTIRSKLNNMKYAINSEFICDLLLVCENCKMFNSRYSVVYKAGVNLLKEIVRLLKEHKLGNLPQS